MSFEIGGSLNSFGNNTIGTPTFTAKQHAIPEKYSGGSLEIKILKSDTQAQAAWRGLYQHAIAAGLDKKQATDFADAWVSKDANQ